VSDKSSFDLMNYLRFWVARFATRFCGIPTLYWSAPVEWEEYMSIGEPYRANERDDE
jgi:hypothetical protein